MYNNIPLMLPYLPYDLPQKDTPRNPSDRCLYENDIILCVKRREEAGVKCLTLAGILTVRAD